MPLHPHLDHLAPGALDIAYRGSDSLQTLDMHVVYAGEAELPLAAWAVGTFVQCINRGLAGGAELSPSAGHAKLLAGPTGEGERVPGELGPDLRFQLEVAGVSPRFLRTMVEYFAASALPHRLVSASLVGSLAPSSDARLSVREPVLRAWLDDANAYVEAFKTPGFRIANISAPRGAAVTVKLANAVTDPVARELESTFSAWQSAILTLPNLAQKGRGFMAPQCTFARTRSSVIARAELFDFARAPARASLSNALAWFHEKIAPIESVQVALC